MRYKEKMPLKAFWEEVEQRLTRYSAAELRNILRAMAEETPPGERQAFLDKLKLKKKTTAGVQKVLQQEDLLADIDDLTRELRAEMKQADYYWEEYGEYDEEDSLGPYEKFVEPLIALFDRTDAVFDYGNFALARSAYQKLFEILDLEDDYGGGIRADDLEGVNINEACARYLRAVYETEPPEDRPQRLFEQMRQTRAWLWVHPTLTKVIQILPEPLSGQARFLQDWIAFLRRQSGSDADAWLREAIGLAEGTSGLEKLAREEGKKRPRAYLDWLAALEREGKHREILAAAREALQTLPAKLRIRAAIADYLCAAAAQLNEREDLLSGRWEAFVAEPILERLISLWEVASAGEERTRLMHQAAQYVKDYLSHPPRQGAERVEWDEDLLERPVWVKKSLLAHAYLLSGDWDAAHRLVAGEQVLGWSGSENPQGLVVSFFLAALSGKSPGVLPVNLKQLWEQTLRDSSGLGFWAEERENEKFQRLMRVYEERLSEVSLSSAQQEKFLSWCLNIAKKRVHAIVSNQHRGSYDKAAILITACAELLRLRGKGEEANSLLEEVRNSFPRHRSFQSELKAAMRQASFHQL